MFPFDSSFPPEPLQNKTFHELPEVLTDVLDDELRCTIAKTLFIRLQRWKHGQYPPGRYRATIQASIWKKCPTVTDIQLREQNFPSLPRFRCICTSAHKNSREALYFYEVRNREIQRPVWTKQNPLCRSKRGGEHSVNQPRRPDNVKMKPNFQNKNRIYKRYRRVQHVEKPCAVANRPTWMTRVRLKYKRRSNCLSRKHRWKQCFVLCAALILEWEIPMKRQWIRQPIPC